MAVCKHRFFFFFNSVFQLQQLELAQIQQRDANLTALAAIGPRKKRPLESGSGSEVWKQCPFICHVRKAGLKEAENADNLLYRAHCCCQMLVKALLCLFYKILIFACS